MSQAREALDNTDQRVDIAVQLLLSNQRLLNHLIKFQKRRNQNGVYPIVLNVKRRCFYGRCAEADPSSRAPAKTFR